jgi:hypothetical protein
MLAPLPVKSLLRRPDIGRLDDLGPLALVCRKLGSYDAETSFAGTRLGKVTAALPLAF